LIVTVADGTIISLTIVVNRHINSVQYSKGCRAVFLRQLNFLAYEQASSHQRGIYVQGVQNTPVFTRQLKNEITGCPLP